MSKQLSTAVVLLIVLLACGHSTRPAKVDIKEGKRSTDTMDKQYLNWLKALQETPLSAGARGDVAYRFIWIRSFQHPVVIRLNRKNEQCLLTEKEFEGPADHEPGKLILNKTIALTDQSMYPLSKN